MMSWRARAPRGWVQRCANERRAFAHAVFACGACAAVFRLIPCALVQHRGSNGAARAGGRGMSGKLLDLLRLRAADARAKEQQACAQQALRRAKQREGRRKPFGEKLQRKDAVAVLLYVMSGHDTACSVFWLEREARKQRANLVDRAVLEGQVLEHYRACDGEALAAAAADDRAAPNSIVGQARAFYRDWRAAVWVEKENATKKVAVSTKALAAWVQAEGSDAMLRGGDGAAAGSALRGKVRVWAVRWRRRMGARLRRPKLEECVPAAALREKAGRFFRGGSEKWLGGPTLRPQIASVFRPQNRAREYRAFTQEGPKKRTQNAAAEFAFFVSPSAPGRRLRCGSGATSCTRAWARRGRRRCTSISTRPTCASAARRCGGTWWT